MLRIVGAAFVVVWSMGRVDAQPSTPPETSPKPDKVASERPATLEPSEKAVVGSPQTSGTSIVAPLLLTFGAAGSFGGALAFDISARHTYSRSKVEANDATQEALWSSANHKRIAAISLYGAGLASGGLAIWLFVRSARGDGATTVARGISVSPMLGVSGGGLLLDARY